MSEELLACPFCGSAAVIRLVRARSWMARCGRACDVNKYGKTKLMTIAAWNTRAAPQITEPVGVEVERVARAICWAMTEESDDCAITCLNAERCMAEKVNDCFIRDARAAIAAMSRPVADVERVKEGEVAVPLNAPEAMWDGLPRQIMLWLDFEPSTPRALFDHLKRCGCEIPAWMKEEGELKALDHVPSKGTRCVLIYRAMIENWLAKRATPKALSSLQEVPGAEAGG